MTSSAKLLAELVKDIFQDDANGGQQSGAQFPGPSGVTGNRIYEPLDQSRQEIRLIKILPASVEDAKIECLITTASLYDKPEFTALSYVWGDPSITEEIHVNGWPLHVTKNLVSALRHIRATAIRYILDSFWVDAVCINQSDVPEKNYQVPLMGSIYGGAKLVLSWLGPESENNMYMLRFFSDFAKALRDPHSRYQNPLDRLQDVPQFTDPQNDGNPYHHPLVLAFMAFQRQTYFRRGWIFQELYLARTLAYLCGHEAISANDLHECTGTLSHFEEPDDNTGPTLARLLSNLSDHFTTGAGAARIKQRTDELNGQSSDEIAIPIKSLLPFTAKHLVSNPLDKVYCLLGITNERVPVDYGMAVTDLYCLVAEKVIRNRSIFTYLGLSPERNVGGTADIPSWVPDWHAYSRSGKAGMNFKENQSNVFGSAKLEILSNHRTLRLWGVRLEVGKIRSSQSFEDRQSLVVAFRDYCLGGSGTPTHPVGVPRFQALFWAALSHLESLTPGSVTEQLLQEQWVYWGIGFTEYLLELSGMSVEGFLRVVLQTAGPSQRSLGDADIPPAAVIRFLRKLFLNPGPETSSTFSWSPDLEALQHWRNELPTILESLSLVYFFSVTEEGYCEFSQFPIGEEDIICAFPGYCDLVVLRKMDSHYVIQGPCWMYGFMNGETVQRLERCEIELEMFEIH